MKNRPHMIGPEPPLDWHGDNGMGTRSTRWLAELLLWPVREALPALDALAARWHDRRYYLGGTADDRDDGDEELWVNTRRVLRAYLRCWKRTWPARVFFLRACAWAVFRAVQDCGRKAFRYRQPPDLRPGEAAMLSSDEFGTYWIIEGP